MDGHVCHIIYNLKSSANHINHVSTPPLSNSFPPLPSLRTFSTRNNTPSPHNHPFRFKKWVVKGLTHILNRDNKPETGTLKDFLSSLWAPESTPTHFPWTTLCVTQGGGLTHMAWTVKGFTPKAEDMKVKSINFNSAAGVKRVKFCPPTELLLGPDGDQA